MKKIFSIGFIAISVASCQSNSSNGGAASPASVGTTSTTVNYQAAKTSIADQEKADPKSFLKVTNGTYKKNLLGEWVIEGNTTSSATVARYKDVVLTVTFYSKTQTLLGTQEFKQFEFIDPGHSVSFKIKSNGFPGTGIIGIDVKSAAVAN